MSRKVLITFLGTGPLKDNREGIEVSKREYRTMPYHIEETIYERSFVADALTDHFGIDTIIMVGTVKSMWEEVYNKFSEKRGVKADEEVYFELVENSEKAHSKSELYLPHKEKIEKVLGKGSHISLIKYGLNEEELDFNITTILELESKLQSGDQLYVDVTHSFRSMPLLLMNTLIYLQNMSKKRVKIVAIFYGMSEMKRELGYAPVVNLKKALEVNNWISGAYSFSEFGDAKKISELLNSIDRSAANRLMDFSNANNLNNMVTLQKSVQNLKGIHPEGLPLIARMTIAPVVQEFIKQIGDCKTTSGFQFKLAVWHRDKHQFYASYLTLVEAIISYVCEVCHLCETDKEERDDAKSILNRKPAETFEKHPELQTLKVVYGKINDIRRKLAHSLPLTHNNDALKRILNEAIDQLQSILN